MPVALLMIALAVSVPVGTVVWLLASFWWGFLAYTGIGVAMVLIGAVLRTAILSRRMVRNPQALRAKAMS